MKKNSNFVGLVICLTGALGSFTASFTPAYGAEKAPCASVYAMTDAGDEEIQTITLSKEGTLGDFIPKDKRCDVTKLRIVGPMYYKDFWVLHACPNLVYLDISLVTISDDGKGVPNCIPENTFDGHETIKTVIFPKTLKAIGDYAFRATTIEEIEIPESVDSLASGVFQFCNNLTKVNVPKAVKSVGNRVFCGCKNLTSITLPDGIEWLKEGMFQDCTALKEVNMPKDMKRVGYSAFNNTGITKVHLYDKVEKIEGKAFYDTDLSEVTCEAMTPPEMQLNSFTTNTYKNATLYIPADAMDSYLDEATWGQFENVKEFTGTDNPVDPDGYTKVEVTTAGHLFEVVSGMQNVVKLRIIGEINDKDFKYMRTMIDLVGVDLSGCTIVDDGEGVANRLPTYAFKGLAKLKEFVLPTSTDRIGGHAFEETGLSSVIIPEHITFVEEMAFLNCKSLQEMVFANPELNISEMTCCGCTALTKLVLPAKCRIIGRLAFEGCTSLELLGLPSTTETIGEAAFANTGIKDLAMGDKMKVIYERAFDNDKLETVTCLALTPPAIIDANVFTQDVYDNAVLKIVRTSEDAYRNNEIWGKFKHIELDNTPIVDPDGFVHIHCLETGDVEIFAPLDIVQKATKIRVTGIVDRMDFYYLSKLTKMEILDIEDVKVLAYYDSDGEDKYLEDHLPGNAFLGCKSMKQIKLPKSIVAIDSWAFAESSIEEIYIPENVTEIGYQAFFYCKDLEKVVIDGKITTTPRSLFSQCSSLTEVVFPETLEELNYGVFHNCTSLEEITLPSNLKTIGELAFENTAITKLTIPAKVNFIDKQAFLDSDLEELTCEGPAADAHLDAFSDSDKKNIIVNVHEADLDSYLDHVVWSQFQHMIVIETGEDVMNGIENVTADNNDFVIADGSIQLNNGAANVAVYDVTGNQLCNIRNAKAGQIISLPAVKGVMLVVIDGRTYKVLN